MYEAHAWQQMQQQRGKLAPLGQRAEIQASEHHQEHHEQWQTQQEFRQHLGFAHQWEAQQATTEQRI